LVAKERGYFGEEGLDNVKVMATGEDELTIEGLKNRTIVFGLDVKPQLVFRENHKGERLYINGGMINDLPLSLMSVKGIKSIADLKGKRIGTPAL
jgi:ABC-type nitrate/sulfonate/bicarbonate transport system substrate-binding protein